MDSDLRTPVVLCWHMHQPGYQDQATGQFLFPWVYLHAIKDYVDMAGHLEAHPEARAVVNFAPILLEQLEAYQSQIERWRHQAVPMTDTLLAALVSESLPLAGSPGFLNLLEQCLRANSDRIIGRFGAYQQLAELANLYRNRPDLQRYVSGQLLADLLVWHHLGWMGETVRRSSAVVQSLQEKARDFTLEDRCALLEVIQAQLASIGPRYRHLAQNGQVELAMSPWAHPILPLLQSLESAREAQPDARLPDVQGYPGGQQRAAWHLAEGRKVFQRFFGCLPVGCWASEGALSQATLALLESEGFQWTASGDSVAHNSVRRAIAAGQSSGHTDIHQPYRFTKGALTVYFRDDGLSDLIGFQYADWHAEDAVADLVGHMQAIANRAGKDRTPVISVIMDGENAWEYYPENGFYFLDALYRTLASHPKLRLTTYRELHQHPVCPPFSLPHLVAGSWIYGTFSTWIGDPDKNRAWELLCEAKQHYDRVMGHNTLSADQREKASRQLGLCEGSDWFWWFGDYNPAPVVREFESLYRRHLANLYQMIGCPAPTRLYQPLSQGGGEPARGGAMRPGHQ